MALTDYAENDEVRAALGVNSKELSDTVLALPVYLMGLTRELNKISTSLPAAFSTVNGIAVDQRTAIQEALYEATRLFSVYAVARQVGVSLASFMPKDITDGKAALGRFAGTPWEDTMADVERMYTDARDGLVATYAAYTNADVPTSVSSPPTTFIASKRSSDPVTGT
jgi:hypothetical protein